MMSTWDSVMDSAEVTKLPTGDDASCPAKSMSGSRSSKKCARKLGSGIFEELADESRLKRNLPMYKKIRIIGQGAFGKAYLVETSKAPRVAVTDSTAGQQRVLKRLKLTGSSEKHREGAFQEALLMRKISRHCPYITQFHEVFLGKGGTQLCIVMEFCSGGDLRRLLRDAKDSSRRLLEAEVVAWASQAAIALQHVHSHGVIHRDVKPENCFFRSEGGDLLLGDFGISCDMDDKSFAKTCVGSPLYLSPEIVNQDRYSYATDVWSFGVMLYEMAMLEPPFKGSNICQIAFKIVGTTPQPVDSSLYSAPFTNLVCRLLEKDPSKRITLLEALVEAPFDPAAGLLAAKHGLQWPPQARTGGVGRSSGLVQRLRKNVGGAATAGGYGGAAPALADVEYGDDFELYDGEDDDAPPPMPATPQYADDFEEEASGSEHSYEEDFEKDSYEDDFENEGHAATGALEELSDERVRDMILQELGQAGLDAAEKLGVLSFAMNLHAQGCRPTAVA
eukprot:TRINITY_DN4423_c0_g1_i2.p1 TRINITY_DN4423_c0_g1~~TRINITY_DN4423_c0_g1_i2.p1  ORF type:complete len:505 (+),score=119.45 TRINITY_DN4423_c0_g1_i2:163-1677(+)